MSKKDLNPEGIINELKGQSVFFRQEAEEQAAPLEDQEATPTVPEKTVRFSERKSERTEIRSEKRSVVLPVRRLSRRYSFEFYDDQITRLKGLKHEAEMRGEKVSLSDMARQALDEYLKSR